jgi:hypothetical protein
MEIYHHAEKRLLAARGIINEISVREPRLGLSPLDAAHIDFLNANILALLDRLKMPRFPRSVKAAEISEQHTGTKVHCPITAHRAGSS